MKTKINFCRKFFTKCSFYKIVSNYFNCELEPWRTVFAFRILELTSSINFIWNWTSSVTNSTKLLQTALGWLVTNCDSWFITNCDKFVPIWDNYYKLWQTNGTYHCPFCFSRQFWWNFNECPCFTIFIFSIFIDIKGKSLRVTCLITW